MENSKSKFLSKTIWVNIFAGLAMIIGVFSPSVAAFMQEHFNAVGGGWALVNIALRLITKKELT